MVSLGKKMGIISGIFIFFLSTQAYTNSVLRLGLRGGYETIDPTKYIDTRSTWIASQIFEPLFRINVNGEVEPWLLVSWNLSADRKKYTFTLREKARFADGASLTCEDVKYSLARALTRKDRLSNLKEIQGSQNIDFNHLEQWKGIQCPDQQHMEVYLQTPSAFFLKVLTDTAVRIVPFNQRQSIEKGDFFLATPYGTGPYVVKEMTKDQVTLIRNEHYWGNKGEVDTIQFVAVYRKPDDKLIDVLYPVMENDNIFFKNFHVEEYYSPSIVFLGFNTQKTPWNKYENRKLFVESINWSQFKHLAYPNSTQPHTGSIIPYGIIGYDPDLPVYPYKPDFLHLKILFEKYPSAKEITVSDNSNQVLLTQAMQNMQLPLARQLHFIYNKSQDIVTLIRTKKLQTFVLDVVMNQPDAYSLLEYFKTNHPLNVFSWSNAEYDRLLIESKKLEMRAEKYETYRKMAKLLRDAYVAVPLVSKTQEAILVRNGFQFDGLGDEDIMYYQLNRVKKEL